ncbi:bifunctional glutamine synthetase adenylyltransferase/deadenyltransferase [Halorhodospira abdelmalekii]|uniref:bifunctional [glutamate--ammonia ligase]-adenylyl-L-tyrosine phosphorylase/[glutamate--ammonia-ligase] adenylyltransferase n=1 Tax=Halorhodospira abdelmalekii TaxID=421629 RepID=UPI00190379FA|nr:bifunctional [glutamate--ammonia ligase]-adenylyl-L-tyrosine phosphorylase/[glutamate--ammonia-ligase] adenylyltransferase [Halorhodospira abdelmalekii]MBK1733780.1 bifunctional glutamine synthetase adenylyltransferase/deadenyltransferase [Halorhodospira abdelmalekii]
MAPETLRPLPENLRPTAEQQLERLRSAGAVPADERIAASLPGVVAASDFVTRSCSEADSGLLQELLESGDLFSAYPAQRYRQLLEQYLSEVTEEAALHSALRRFRRREAVRIAYRALTGWADLDETLIETSDMAEAAIDLALAWLYRALTERWGVPRGEQGDPQQLVVLGMGKLGGRELNFSSDLDLIFAFPEQGETDGARPRSNDEFFVKLGRQLITALDAITPEGRAFRVDMRLRPNGDAGPLALSFAALESYYESQGREWERYAMVKARCVGGDYTAGNALTRDLRPFVYRRYLDYGALEQLRETKAMIASEVSRRGTEENLKTGEGGIREVEFIAQAFQLIRGGRDNNLRSRQLLKTLYYLREQAILPEHSADTLIAAYRFLRRAENAVQMLNDEQAHTVPTDPTARARVAWGSGYTDLTVFEAELTDIRRQVHSHFEQVFSAPQASAPATTEPDAATELWGGRLSPAEACERLSELGFTAPDTLEPPLRAFRDGATVRSLSARGRHRLDRLMPLLIGACAQARHPSRTLHRTLELIDTIARRTAYLALLVEHPMALSQLVQLCDGSAWVARFIAAHPLLLDELLDPRTLYEPLGREALEHDLALRLAQIDVEDLEQQMEVVRQFKQAQQLKVAAADVSGAAPLMVVSDYLSHIAEVTLEHTVALCFEHLRQRHGQPHFIDSNGERHKARFAVIAYGKLGGLELGYNSDLDLVFIHNSSGSEQETDGPRVIDNQAFFARLAQRIIHFLTTPTPSGFVYEVDARLRPSGKAGLMSTSLEAFTTYQWHSAWTWEHQALVRARAVAGDEAIRSAFAQARADVLQQPREHATLREEVRSMRNRQRQEKAARDPQHFDLKNDRGGLTDIEFLVQYWVLAHAHAHPALVEHTDNIRLLRDLAATGVLKAETAHALANAYRAYRRRLHHLALQDEGSGVAQTELSDALGEHRRIVTQLWQEVMEA